MKSLHKLYLISFASIFAVNLHAQSGYFNSSVTIYSDSTSPSLLLSTLPSTTVLDQSPYMLAATWGKDHNQHCHSILAFDFEKIPHDVLKDLSQIVSAELILTPLDTTLVNGDDNKVGRILVSRIASNWNESLISWSNQPQVDTTITAGKVIRKYRKQDIHVDVTKLFKAMIRNGNYGFLIQRDSTLAQQYKAANLFASPKHQVSSMRPALLITYRSPVSTNEQPLNTYQQRPTRDRSQETYNNNQVPPDRTTPTVTPSTTPVVNNKTNVSG